MLNTLHFLHEQNSSWRQSNNLIIEERFSEQGKNANNKNWKGNKKKYGKTDVWCCGSVVDGGICGDPLRYGTGIME